MKKQLFFIATMFIVVSIFGQTKCPKNYCIPFTDITIVDETQFVPSERQSFHFPQSKEGTWPIGLTFQSAISNASARNTASAHPDGDMAAVWTFLKEGAGAQRGTGYNWYTQSSKQWDPIPDKRLENPQEGNPGFPSHAFTENGEIVVSHNAGMKCLIVLTRDKRGEGEWTQNYFYEPSLPEALYPSWPSICANGNTVHMVAVYTNTATTVANNIPIYYRSTDGGKTWDIKNYRFPDMPDCDKVGHFADNYMITAKGDHVVYAYVNMQGQEGGRGGIGYMESFDAGVTWTYHQVLVCIYDDLPVDNFSFTGRNVTAAIDDEDSVHIAFSGYTLRMDGDDMKMKYYPFSTAIVYWKENMPTLTPEYFDTYFYTEQGVKYVHFGYLEFPNVLSFPSLLGYEEWLFFSGTDSQWIQGNNNSGGICAPRIVAEDGKVFLSYGSIIERPLGVNDGTVMAFFRGVFLTVSDDNGNSFNQRDNTSWISYGPNYFYCDWSEWEPTEENMNIDSIEKYVIYELRLENSFPTMAMKSGNDELLIQWYNTYFPGVKKDEESYDVYTLSIRKDSAGKYNNTGEVFTGKWNNYNIGIKEPTGGIQNMNIFPNPAQNTTTVLVNSICSKPYSLSVSNMMGQVLQTQKGKLGYGENRIELNVNNFAPGVYFVNIKTENATRTQKLIVK